MTPDTRKIKTNRNQVCVVESAQFLLTSSVVVTFVQVIQSDTTCPARSDKQKRGVQRLKKRAHVLRANASGEL